MLCLPYSWWSLEEGVQLPREFTLLTDSGLLLSDVGVLQEHTKFVHVFILQQAVVNFLQPLLCVLVRTLQIAL